MARFNPFAKRSCKYGAPMGRVGHNAALYDGTSKLYARHMGGDGSYDRGGAYWGSGNVYAVWTRGGGFCAYVHAMCASGAIKEVQALARDDGDTYTGSPDVPAFMNAAR